MNDRSSDNANQAFLLTPPGVAAIAVVRLVGGGVEAFLRAHFSAEPRPNRPVHGRLTGGGRTIDDPVVVVSEDVRRADLNLHGGTWVVHSVLQLARGAGFAVIERLELPLPPETTDAADALEHEILSHLPLARTELAVRTLLNQRKLWMEMVWLRPNSGGHQSFPSLGTPGEGVATDEDMARNRLLNALHSRGLWNLLHPPTVAIVGAANVGKSTLANALFGQERSITADLPGTTRDWVGEIADLDGLAVTLVDTPGLRRTEDAIESEAIRRSREPVAAAQLVIVVLDAGRPMDEEQTAALYAHPGALVVANKCDQRPAWEVNSIAAMEIVATTGEGVDALQKEIHRRFDVNESTSQTQACWTERQRTIIQQACAMPVALHELWRKQSC